MKPETLGDVARMSAVKPCANDVKPPFSKDRFGS
jgi:hypothetical protein